MKATPKLVALACMALAACRATQVRPLEAMRTTIAPGRSIVVCGAEIDIDAPVVVWTQAPGYDAYSQTLRFAPVSADAEAPTGLRYQPGRVRKNADGSTQVLVEPDCADPERLAEVVDQFVVHYDVCGTSATCFRVLHDLRGLSVHFLLDIDGTIYQTLDVRDQAFHATKANSRSVGIEIANIGAYPVAKTAGEMRAKTPLDEWYAAADAGGPYITIPARLGDGGVRTPGFIGRPARSERVRGVIQGETLEQYDFTAAQYESLAKLIAGLRRVLPKIAADAPRDAEGRVKSSVLSAEEFDAFEGVLGHYHVQTNKTDPGPAFDWERVLEGVTALGSSDFIRP